MRKRVLLSFDVEEFDLPREHGGKMSVKRGAEVSAEGLGKILDVLSKNGVRATFFTTVNFAKEQPGLVKRIVNDGHELAGHGVEHFRPAAADAKKCKRYLEKEFGVKVVGWRQPRMQKIDYSLLHKWGYAYDTSVNPAFIPGRYNNLRVPRRPYLEGKIVEIPTSVATFMRVPLFWLALHLFPFGMYMRFARMSLKKTGYFATYFHPWEFADLLGFREVPGYIKRNSGDKLVERLDKLVKKLKETGCEFVEYKEFAKSGVRK